MRREGRNSTITTNRATTIKREITNSIKRTIRRLSRHGPRPVHPAAGTVEDIRSPRAPAGARGGSVRPNTGLPSPLRRPRSHQLQLEGLQHRASPIPDTELRKDVGDV